MNRRMILMLLAVGILFGGIFGFKAFVNAMIDDFFDNMPAPTATITAGETREMPWTPVVDTVGSFVPVQGAMLTAEAAGIVREIRFESGSRVEAGAELVILESETDRARLLSLESAERLARLEMERARQLATRSNISEAERQRLESEADQAVAAVNEQRARIAQKTVRAPFAGEVGIRRVNVGQYVSPGDPVVSLQSIDPIYLNFDLPERRVVQIQRGQEVTVRVDAHDAEFRGVVNAIEPSVRDSTRTFTIQALIENPQALLRAGMFGRVSLATGEPETVLVVPLSAVSFSPYGDSVYVVTEDGDDQLRVNRRFIQTGARRGDLVVVREGLEPGTRVATSGLLKLRNDGIVVISDDEAVQPRQDLDPRPDDT